MQARDLFTTIDSMGDGYIDFVEWSDFMSLMRLGGLEADAAATASMRGATPATILSLLVPAAEVELSPAEQTMLRSTLRRADSLAAAASRSGVTIMVDAEQTYLQPAIDYVTLNMMRKYNRPNPAQWHSPEIAHVLHVSGDILGGSHTRRGTTLPPPPPLTAWPYNTPDVLATSNLRYSTPGGDVPAAYPVVYTTYQAYLTDALSRVSIDLQRAKREQFLFGAKLVRGAYMLQERPLAKTKGYKDPIHRK